MRLPVPNLAPMYQIGNVRSPGLGGVNMARRTFSEQRDRRGAPRRSPRSRAGQGGKGDGVVIAASENATAVRPGTGLDHPIIRAMRAGDPHVERPPAAAEASGRSRSEPNPLATSGQPQGQSG